MSHLSQSSFLLPPVSRREMLQLSATAGMGTLLAGVPSWNAFAAKQSKTKRLNRYPQMMQRYFEGKLKTFEESHSRRLAALKNEADAKAYVKSVQQRIQQSFGPFPEKTPLNPRITGKVERETYTIENVIFESRPQFFVTANLYLPKGRKFPLPGVVGTCGHSREGKAAETYQSFAQGLAQQGYVVLIFDPIGQGERLQYPDEHLKSKIGNSVREHLHAGNQQFLVNESFSSWRAWDGIRALDYLLTRKEVDPEHIGVTGNSGGGTATTYLCGVEQRWTMAAPCCFVTTFRRNLENELPADTEQCPRKSLALGLDHMDYIAAMAPKPVIILSKEKDFFDVRGSEEAYQKLKRLYKLLGKEENIQLFTGPTYHGYSQENREAMYGMFNKATGASQGSKEPDITVEKKETLQCTKSGQVLELKSKPVYSFTKAKSIALKKERASLKGIALIKAVQSTLKMPPQTKRPDYRILSGHASRKFPSKRWATYAVQTEEGVEAICYRLDEEILYSRPPKTGKKAILYISHLSADAELRDDQFVRGLYDKKSNVPLFTCDVRGSGESQPNTCGGTKSFYSSYGSDYFYAIHSIMLDQPYVGQKTFDVLQVLEWLKSVGHTDIHLVAKGRGALPATFAAMLHDSVQQVTLKNALTSYADIAETEEYKWSLSTLLPNVLEKFDLPDCYNALKEKQLKIIAPWKATDNAINPLGK
ncbi:hypothetical protein MNBD_PLANCTO02-1995 [hydrothermal vent metagenome]|uniref:Acetyl xylan esterase domain-containing protein n=1 Tax=hydrothermal vent metagenome TaxID=652676 RepID=A0A3B1DXZ7_9ZZZZ